jgi:hypothetical protein
MKTEARKRRSMPRRPAQSEVEGRGISPPLSRLFEWRQGRVGSHSSCSHFRLASEWRQAVAAWRHSRVSVFFSLCVSVSLW